MALKSIGYGTNILNIDETGSTLFGLYIGYNDNDTIISADLKLWKILFNEKDITKQSSIYIDKLGEYAYITIKNFQGLKLLENKDVSILEIDAPITNKITKITTIHKMSYKFYKHLKTYAIRQLIEPNEFDIQVDNEHGNSTFNAIRHLSRCNDVQESNLSYFNLYNNNQYTELLVYEGELTDNFDYLTVLLPVAHTSEEVMFNEGAIMYIKDPENSNMILQVVNSLMGYVTKVKIVRTSDLKEFYGHIMGPMPGTGIFMPEGNKFKDENGFEDIYSSELNIIGDYKYFRVRISDWGSFKNKETNTLLCDNNMKDLDTYKVYITLQ